MKLQKDNRAKKSIFVNDTDKVHWGGSSSHEELVTPTKTHWGHNFIDYNNYIRITWVHILINNGQNDSTARENISSFELDPLQKHSGSYFTIGLILLGSVRPCEENISFILLNKSLPSLVDTVKPINRGPDISLNSTTHFLAEEKGIYKLRNVVANLKRLLVLADDVVCILWIPFFPNK